MAGFFFALVTLFPLLSFAADTCTDALATSGTDQAGNNIVAGIIQLINQILAVTGKQMFTNIIDDSGYKDIVMGMITLSVALYGAMLLFGIVQPSPGVVVNKLIVFGIIAWIISPSGWDFFYNTVATFFVGSMNELINIFSMRAVETVTGVPLASSGVTATNPLWVLNAPFGLLVSTKFLITLLGVIFTGPYGIVIALIMIWGAFNLMMALFHALFIYIKSLIGLWFLFGLAPIFIILIMFKRTKKIFDGWLNLVIYLTILPILTFAFIAFFLVIIVGSLTTMLGPNWCWGKLDILSGTPFAINWWRRDVGGSHDGNWTVNGYMNSGVLFPVEIIDVLFFLLSSYIAWQYLKFIPQLAQQLSESSINLGSIDAVTGFMQSRGWTPEQKALGAVHGAGKAGSRLANSFRRKGNRHDSSQAQASGNAAGQKGQRARPKLGFQTLMDAKRKATTIKRQDPNDRA